MCGIVGMFGPDIPLNVMSKMMTVLNHRGEQNAGLVLAKNNQVFYETSEPFGPVSALSMLFMKTFSIYKEEDFCDAAIGHLRYGTKGDSSKKNAQPLYIRIGDYEIWLSHNGDTPNFEEMHQDLIERWQSFSTTADSEFILKYIALASKDDILDSIRLGLRDYKGTYALLMLVKKDKEIKLIAARDPTGNRPLALGKLNNGYILASENMAFEIIKGKFIREIEPGEILIISKEGLESRRLENDIKKLAHCVFEQIYFSRPDSKVFGLPVDEFREALGKIAAERYGHLVEKDDIVTYIPDSARHFAVGFCKVLKRPMDEIFVRHHTSIMRSFTQADQNSRLEAIRNKMNIIRKMIAGKRVWVLDDSMVRGNSARRIVRSLKNSDENENADWVGMGISAPPIIGPSKKGVAIIDNLIAAFYTKNGETDKEAIRKEIEADYLFYLNIDDLKEVIKSLKGNPNNFCYGCFEGREPIWEVW